MGKWGFHGIYSWLMIASVQLVQITPMSRTGLWYAHNELVIGAFVNQLSYQTGAPLCTISVATCQTSRSGCCLIPPHFSSRWKTTRCLDSPQDSENSLSFRWRISQVPYFILIPCVSCLFCHGWCLKSLVRSWNWPLRHPESSQTARRDARLPPILLIWLLVTGTIGWLIVVNSG